MGTLKSKFSFVWKKTDLMTNFKQHVLILPFKLLLGLREFHTNVNTGQLNILENVRILIHTIN